MFEMYKVESLNNTLFSWILVQSPQTLFYFLLSVNFRVLQMIYEIFEVLV